MDFKDGWPVRAVALATVGYSVAISVSPKLLAKPCRLLDATGGVPTSVAELTRSIGVRDAALAAALVVSPTGRPMAVLTAARVVSDGADAVWFARLAPGKQRIKVAGAAGGWAVLELLAWLATRRAVAG